MNDPFIIYQGRPESDYFALAHWKIPRKDQEVICIHPRTQKKIRAKYHGFFRYLWAEVPESFCLQAYGADTAELKAALENKFPELRNKEKIIFLLLEQI